MAGGTACVVEGYIVAQVPANHDEKLQVDSSQNTFSHITVTTMSHPGSHSEAFGLKGQDESGFPTQVVGSKEGAGILGGAGHPSGAASNAPNQNQLNQNNPGRTGEEGTVGGIKHGTGDNTVPGSGGSIMPSQGTGKISDDHSTADILNPRK